MRADPESLELDLYHRHAVDEQDHIVTVVAVVGVDAELVNDFKVVFAPVLDVDQRIVQGGAIVAGEGVDAAYGLGGGEDILRDDFVEQPGELGVCQADVVQCFEFFAKVLLERSPVADLFAVFVFQPAKFFDQPIFKLAFRFSHGEFFE